MLRDMRRGAIVACALFISVAFSPALNGGRRAAGGRGDTLHRQRLCAQ